MYYFNDNGVCSDGNELHNLFIVDAKIIATSGTVATRGDSTECWCEDCGKHTKLKEV